MASGNAAIGRASGTGSFIAGAVSRRCNSGGQRRRDLEAIVPYPGVVPDPNKIPLEVSIFVCTDCGSYGPAADDCRTGGHRVEMVNYEIGASQTQPVARTRVEDLKRHGRRLIDSHRDE